MFALMLTAATISADWPSVRGQDRDGTSSETGLLSRWPDGGPDVLWTQSLGQGYSAVVIATDRAVTHHQTPTGQYVSCFDAATGRSMWSRRVGLPYDPVGIYPGPRSTPVIASGRVIAVTPDAEVFCLSLQTGTVLWRVDLFERFGTSGVDFGYAASPLVLDGRIILPVGGMGASVVALDLADGSTLWATGDEPASYCTPTPITVGGRTLVVNYLQNHIVITDPADGRPVWKSTGSAGYDEHAAVPVWSPPYLILAAPFRAGAQAYRLSLQDGDLSVEPAWHQA